MTIQDIVASKIAQVVCLSTELDREISKPFCCDLLSIAMSKAPKNCAWVTVMANMNTIAVATLSEASCIMIAEGMDIEPVVIAKAKENNITIFQTEQSVFDAAYAIHGMIYDSTNL